MSVSFRTLFWRQSAGPINTIHIMGERNSGTNYVQSLILKNCRSVQGGWLFSQANQARLGWKHGFPTFKGVPHDVLGIVVHREPLAWLQSMRRTPWHAPSHLRGLPFSQFIRHEWVAMVDDTGLGVQKDDPIWHHEMMSERDPMTGRRFANVMRLRNAKNRAFSTLDHMFPNILRLNYEAVLADQHMFLDALCTTYGFQRAKQFTPVIYDRATPGRGVFVPKPLETISAVDMQFIKQELDLQIEETLGYNLGQRHLVSVA